MEQKLQRIAIAGALGKRLTSVPPTWYDQDSSAIPDYPADLNACHEMEKTLTDAEWKRYIICLAFVLLIKRTAHATAAQRCEAFLRVKGLWTEEVQPAKP